MTMTTYMHTQLQTQITQTSNNEQQQQQQQQQQQPQQQQQHQEEEEEEAKHCKIPEHLGNIRKRPFQVVLVLGTKPVQNKPAPQPTPAFLKCVGFPDKGLGHQAADLLWKNDRGHFMDNRGCSPTSDCNVCYWRTSELELKHPSRFGKIL